MQDPDTGAWVTAGAGAEIIFDGSVDVQDEGAVIARDSEGRATETSDAKAFLQDESKVSLLKKGDVATVVWADGTEQDAEIRKVVRLDGKVFLGFL